MATAPIDPLISLDKLSPDERAELAALLEAQHGVQPLADFIAENYPSEPPPPHLRVITDVIESMRQTRKRKVCLSFPPQHGKSTTIARGIAWWLKHSPADVCAYASYSDDQALGWSRRIRDMVRDVGVPLMDGAQLMSRWYTQQEGGLIAAGLGGGITGKGVSGLFVVDDPYKDRQEAESRVTRERIWERFNGVVFTRLHEASVLVVHTRWHEDDLIGRLAEKDGWEYINLPAIAEDEHDPLGRAIGTALWPARYPLAELEAIREQQGDWLFSAMYQGRPRPRGAAVFGDPHYYDPALFDVSGCRLIIGGDPAATESTRADHAVALLLAVRGYGNEAVGYVRDVWRGQVEVPTYVEVLRRMSEANSYAPIAVEAVGGFKAVPQFLRKLDPTLDIRKVKMGGDKFLRAQLVAAAWNAGRVLVPKGAPWLKAFLTEIRAFTGVSDAEDDQVDALAHGWNSIARSGDMGGPASA